MKLSEQQQLAQNVECDVRQTINDSFVGERKQQERHQLHLRGVQWCEAPVEHSTREEEARGDSHHGVGGEGSESFPKEESSHICYGNGRNVSNRVKEPRENTKIGRSFAILAFQR